VRLPPWLGSGDKVRSKRRELLAGALRCASVSSLGFGSRTRAHALRHLCWKQSYRRRFAGA